MRLIGFSWDAPRINSTLTDLQYLIASLSSSLRVLGHELTLVVPAQSGDLPSFSDLNMVHLKPSIVDYPNVISYGLSMPVQVVSQLRYTISGPFTKILCFEWGGCVMGLLAKYTQPCCMGKELNCIVISTEFERGDPSSSIVSASVASVEGWVFSMCDKVFSLSEKAFNSLKSRYGISADYVPSVGELAKVISK